MESGGRAPITPRRKWTALTVATLVLMVSYWSIMFAVVASSIDDAPEPGPVLAFGAAIAPFVFVVLAFMSDQPNAAQAVLKAMGLGLVVAVPLVAFVDPVTGLVAGFGSGGVMAITAAEAHKGRSRWLAMLALTTYVFVLGRVVPEITLIIAPLLVFPTIGITDSYMEYRAAEAEAKGVEAG